jgi:hypothetical protein
MGPISRLGQTYTFRRFAPGTYVKGVWVSGAEVVPTDNEGNAIAFSMVASIQRLTPNEMLALPEGQRTSEWIKIYTTTKLEKTIEENKTKGDIVSYDGDEFEVIKIEDWTRSPIPHYKVHAVRLLK